MEREQIECATVLLINVLVLERGASDNDYVRCIMKLERDKLIAVWMKEDGSGCYFALGKH